MAKSDASLQAIDLHRAFSPPLTPKWAEGSSINAFDTETHDGDPFLLSVAWDDGETEVYPVLNGPSLMDGQDIFELITNRRARSAINVWYNLSFDADVILSTVLNRDELGKLSLTGSVETNGYEISYIPSKFMSIKDDNGHSWMHYDIAQFFYTKLENAVDEWLPEKEKKTELIETNLFGSNSPENMLGLIDGHDRLTWDDLPISRGEAWTQSHAWDYIHENYDLIREYAKADADITRELWEEATDIAEGLEIPMGRPFSTGYLAESYLNEHLGHKPGLGPKGMRQMAWESYQGGRFEVFKRGDIGPVAGPDINSAYPWVLANLPDPKTLTWTHALHPSIDEIKDADYGFIRADVTTNASRAIQPFAIKMKKGAETSSGGKLKYPALQDHTITTIKPIFELAYDYDYLTDFYIKEAWLASESMHADYPFGFIPKKYDERKTYAAKGRDKLELFIKIVLNSMYGKMCQTTPKRKEIEDETIELEPYQSYVNELQLPPDMREIFSGGIVERLEAGAWFNPFLASYITGMTRYELHKRTLEYGLEDNAVMFATDSMMIELNAFEKSDFAKDLVPDDSIPYEKQLGMWDYDYKGDAFVIGAGIYEVDRIDADKIKTKTRGFDEADLQGNLRKSVKKATDKIDIKTTRPITAKEAIWHGQSLSDVSNFTDFDRELRADMDDKRQWQGKATFRNLLSETQKSEPLNLSS